MSLQKPKLLFLAYYFPPTETIGRVRTWNMAKYLSRMGWDVTVVTPSPYVWRLPDEKIIDRVALELEKEGIKRISTGHGWRCLSPIHLKVRNSGVNRLWGILCRRMAAKLRLSPEIGWVRHAKRACSMLRKEDVDIILVSGGPYCAFGLAKWLSEKLNRPYVLDYRDLWTGGLHRNPKSPKVLPEEQEYLQGSAAVTIVSPSWALDLGQRYGMENKIHVVSNGFDPEEMSQVQPMEFPHFAIVYAGIFYPPKRVITPFMEALKQLKAIRGDEQSAWSFHYYGDWGEHVRKEAERFGVMDKVKIHGNVPRAIALSAVAGAGVSVVITSLAEQVTLADQGMITGKVFEALGLNVPVLLICPMNSDVARLDNGKSIRAFQKSNTPEMAAWLHELIEGKGEKMKRGEQYSWTALSKQMNDILLSCL